MFNLGLDIDHVLAKSIIEGTRDGLLMTGLEAKPVGVTRLYVGAGMESISVMVGMNGRSSGNVMINATDLGVRHLASHLVGEPMESIDGDCLDAYMEIGNIIAGSLKSSLDKTEHHVEAISLPSVVFGRSYSVYYSKGIETVSVQFELDTMPMHQFQDRFFTTSVSLLRGSGSRSSAKKKAFLEDA